MSLEADSPLRARNICFTPEPRNGSRYDLVLAEDPHGGVLVIWPNVATYRWYKGDYLKFLHGRENEVDRQAIYDYLESLWALKQNERVLSGSTVSRPLTADLSGEDGMPEIPEV